MSDKPRDSDLELLLALTLLLADDGNPDFRILARRLRDRLREGRHLSSALDALFWAFEHTDRDRRAAFEVFSDRLAERFRRSDLWSPELNRFLRSVTSRRWRIDDVRQQATLVTESILEQFQESQSDTISDLLQRIDAVEITQSNVNSELRAGFDEVTAEIRTLRSTVSKQNDEIRAGADSLYSYIWLASVGANTADAKLIRHIPVRVYVTDPVPDRSTLMRLVAALEGTFEEIGLEKSLELPEESGSWLKRFFARTKEAASQEDVRRGLEKIERAAQVAILDKPQAEANKHQAEATSTLINALKDTPSACIQVGSLLVVKRAGIDGKPAIVARTLTPSELKRLEEDQTILADPQRIFEVLASASSSQRNASELDRHGVAQISPMTTRKVRVTPALPPVTPGHAEEPVPPSDDS